MLTQETTHTCFAGIKLNSFDKLISKVSQVNWLRYFNRHLYQLIFDTSNKNYKINTKN